MSSNSDFSDTRDVLTAFSDALRFWALHLTAEDGDFQKAVPPASLANPLAELDKTAKLIKAHTTKVGIVFEPSKIAGSGNATHATVSELSKSFILFVSALSSVSPSEVSHIFYDEIRSVCTTLVNAAEQFTEELQDLLAKNGSKAEESTQTAPDSEARLVSVGKIWNTCDNLSKLISDGKLKFLEKKTKMHLSLIEDGLEEFAEWTENPQNFDGDDPFGLDDFDDSEDGEFSDDEVPGGPAQSSDDESVQESVLAFSKTWLQKFKLVKLLFLSITKSLGSLVSGKQVDELFTMEGSVCRNIDALIVELMMNQVLDEEITEISKAIDKSCSSIIQLLRAANKTSDSKVKWCASWESKFSELSTEMYST